MSCDAVIDSYAWIEYFQGSEYGKKAKKYIENGNCATPTIVLAELSDKYHREGWKFWEKDLRFIVSKTKIIDLYKMMSCYMIKAEDGDGHTDTRTVRY
jgi:hypothetical protein